MRDIQDLIENVERYKNVKVQKRFKSKKNTVAYVLLNGQPTDPEMVRPWVETEHGH